MMELAEGEKLNLIRRLREGIGFIRKVGSLGLRKRSSFVEDKIKDYTYNYYS